METIEHLLRAARKLSVAERRRLVNALQEDAHQNPEVPNPEAISGWIALAGRFHSNATDVSTDKYRHLADVYSDER
jgi:hypothetical protein